MVPEENIFFFFKLNFSKITVNDSKCYKLDLIHLAIIYSPML